MSTTTRSKKQNVLWAGVLAALCLMVLVLSTRSAAQADRLPAARPATATTNSVLYRFDPTSQTFMTIALPLNSYPTDVAVVGQSPAHVWVAEYGGGRIGRVVFTDTASYQLVHYPITTPAGSPYRLTVDGSWVWFTERGANRVGRLNSSTGVINEFYGNGLSANAGLSDIQVAPNGRVWLGAEWSQRLVRLTVTSTVNYAFREYADTNTNFTVAPVSIAIEDDNSILLTVPSGSAASRRLAQFTPSIAAFQWAALLNNTSPQEVIVVPGKLWFSDKQRNELSQVELGTYTNLNNYGPITRPVGLAAESPTVLWSALHSQPPAIGRLQAGVPPSSTVTSYALPGPGLTPSAIAVAPDGAVWVTAYRSGLYLPSVRRD